jgi:small subunit ribosomal protein S8
MQTDPIADMFTAIRNAQKAGKKTVDVWHSKMKRDICEVLKEEGFIEGYDIIEMKSYSIIRIYLKYNKNGEPVIHGIKKMSTPGRRVYVGVKKLPLVRRGLGICILSTSKGIISDKKAKKFKAGGEFIGMVW